MDLRLTEQQEMTRNMARELATKEIAPIAAEIDETGHFPKEVIQKMADAGLFGTLIPPTIRRGGRRQARLPAHRRRDSGGLCLSRFELRDERRSRFPRPGLRQR